MNNLKSLFLLDPDVIFLNHGSFGACPRPVFESYQRWQRELERQPVRFIQTVLNGELVRARTVLAAFIGADPDGLLFVPNATHGVNMVARSLQLGPGDEILTTDHEYGACDNVWDFVCRKTGAVVRRVICPLPKEAEQKWVERFWSGVTDRTKVIFLSHISSPTALRFPIEEICRRAREADILTLIDGAHAPGQIPLDLETLDADFYTGNCHKWLMAPKGSGFLYVRRERRALVEPLLVSWGWSRAPEFETGSPFLDQNQWWGTNDLSAYLAVADAVAFQAAHDWVAIRSACSQLLSVSIEEIARLTALPALDQGAKESGLQMGAVELPRLTDLREVKSTLLDLYAIEVPLVEWQGRHFVRISVQGYNAQEDLDALVSALEKLLPLYTA